MRYSATQRSAGVTGEAECEGGNRGESFCAVTRGRNGQGKGVGQAGLGLER